jgi:hypothetical protein
MDDEDANLGENLATLGSDAPADLRRVLEAPQSYHDALFRQFIAPFDPPFGGLQVEYVEHQA